MPIGEKRPRAEDTAAVVEKENNGMRGGNDEGTRSSAAGDAAARGSTGPSSSAETTEELMKRMSGHSDPSDVIVEVEEEIEDSIVLVRLPHLDFFSQTHLCESPCEAAAGHSSGLHAGKGEPSSCGTYVFDPNALGVELDEHGRSTLASAHPRFVLNKGTPNEMRLVGTWQETSRTGGVTNRAVIKLEKRRDATSIEVGSSHTIQQVSLSSAASSSVQHPSATGTAFNAATTAGDAHTNDEDTNASSTPGVVASLFAHAQAGITADEVRQTRLNASSNIQTTAIYAPSAVLVLHPIMA